MMPRTRNTATRSAYAVAKSKTPKGKGIRFKDGKTVFLRMATYNLVKRISKSSGMPYNRVIHEAVKDYAPKPGSFKHMLRTAEREADKETGPD
jgi:hypothetical protein